MEANNAKQLLIKVVIALGFHYFQGQIHSSRTLACLTRVGLATGKPIFWSVLFGRNDNNDGAEFPQTYDKDAELHATWNTNDWILQHKFELELHNVTTSDGYQLQLQHLPQPGHQPVVLVHGLCSSSLSWVLLGPDKSLAFQLHKKRYDVWLANLRGSSYGRNHTQHNTSSVDFWNYSFHEHGAYDLPAIIDHVRNESSFPQVLLIGHSQAFNSFLVMCAVQPIYNERVLLMQALAPILELRDQVKFGADDVRKVKKYMKSKATAQNYEIFPADYLKKKCLQSSSNERSECVRLLQTFTGKGAYSKNVELLIYSQLLHGGSVREVTHLTQIWKSGDFIPYDYGWKGNEEYYNAVAPSLYDLKQVSVPIVLHFGQNDAIATPTGVHRIYSQLLETVVGIYRVSSDDFSHLDFLLSGKVKTLVNDKLIQIMEKFLAGNLTLVVE